MQAECVSSATTRATLLHVDVAFSQRATLDMWSV